MGGGAYVPEIILQTRGLSKRFATGDPVLEDVDLDITAGEIFGLIGKSGAGKSTLARCVNFLERPSSGDVLFEGKPLSSLAPRDLYKARRSMGMIFQQFNLLMQRSVLGNVLFPMEIAHWKKSKAVARAKELLDLVKLSDKENAYPATLSGGQRQRVAIARAMALSPRVLLCDEATSALDPETTRGILALLRDINQRLGVTIIVITHEMLVIESICTRVAILDNSHVAEIGPVREVFTHPKTEAARALVQSDGRAERLLRLIESNGLTVEEVLSRVGIV
jgi:D-methionine transport system ATP-binding protein